MRRNMMQAINLRAANRANEMLRPIQITRQYIKHAEGSVLIECGHTKVICRASSTPGVPPFLKDSGKGWVTAEYGMLPRSTHTRMQREAAKGKQAGRTQEIQRLIARSLRAAVDLDALGENTITIDCDVIQADGGTRTASITGGCVALVEAFHWMQKRKMLKKEPLKHLIAAISVGIFEDMPVLDLDYAEDAKAQTDMNVVMTEKGDFIEIQGTAEAKPFHLNELTGMLELAKKGILDLIAKQKRLLDLP